MNSGFAIHCHHDILVEYCYDYKGRVKAIKKDKPLTDQTTRLRLFKILPEEVLKDIPQNLQKAEQEWQKAEQEWQKADQEWQKAEQQRQKADQNLQKADQNLQKAEQEWQKAEQDIFHKKWCGCKEWNGKEIVFIKE